MGECLILRAGSGVDTSGANATSDKILQGYTGYVNDVLVTGSIPIYDRNSEFKTTELSDTDDRPVFSSGENIVNDYIVAVNTDGVKRFCIQVPILNSKNRYGYYDTDSIIGASYSGPDTLYRSFIDESIQISEGKVLSGYTVFDHYGKIEGSMPNNGNISYSLPINGSYNIPAGYHAGAGVVSQSVTTQGGWTITPTTWNILCTGVWKYVTGAIWVAGSGNLVPWNIKKGVNIFGVVGTWQGF